MKSLSSALQAHLAGEVTTLAWLVKLTRTDGVAKGFTTFDRDLVVGGVTYRADGALTPSSVASGAGLATDSMDIAGILDSAEIAEADIDGGLYDHARVDVSVCNWADVSQGVVSIRRGWLGQIARAGAHYVAELRGLHDLLQRPVGVYYTPECRFDLGDASCGVNLAALTVTGAVTSVIDHARFADSARTEGDNVFAYGKLTWTSGANFGLAMEVKSWVAATKTFALWLPMPNAIAVGDAYTVYPGCDKRFATCRDTFSNGANFGGFPYVPGVGNILKYPG